MVACSWQHGLPVAATDRDNAGSRRAIDAAAAGTARAGYPRNAEMLDASLASSRGERRSVRLFTLCALYFAQGIPWGFTTIAIPAYFGARGVTSEAIGIALTTTALPYAFKWVWGPIIDTTGSPRFGRRRPWIVVSQLMMAASLLAMVAIDDIERDVRLLVWPLLIHTVFSALQDAAVDALAIDVLAPEERGRANGRMSAARYAGGIVGAAGLSWLLARTSLQAVLVVQAVILFAFTAVPLRMREQGCVLGTRPRVGEVVRSLALVFSLRSNVVTAVLMLLLTFAIGLLSANAFALFTQHLGWSSEAYAQLTGGLGMVAGFVGAMVGGELARRRGPRGAIAIASVAMACGWGVFGLSTAWWSTAPFVYTMALFEQVCVSAMVVGIFALCMEVSWSPTAATQFTAYIAMSNFSAALGYRFTGLANTWFDFATCYLVAAVLQVAITVLLVVVDPRQTARELPLPKGAPIPRRGIVTVLLLAATLAVFTAFVVDGLL